MCWRAAFAQAFRTSVWTTPSLDARIFLNDGFFEFEERRRRPIRGWNVFLDRPFHVSAGPDKEVRMIRLRFRSSLSVLVVMVGATGPVTADDPVPAPPLPRQGIGVPMLPTRCPATFATVRTAQELRDTLASGFAGTIVIPANTEITLDGYRGLRVGSCVTIKGTRGGLDPGALLRANTRTEYGVIFNVVGQHVRIEGLRFEGPVKTDNRNPMPQAVVAIQVGDNASSVQIDNNSFCFWSVAVDVNRSPDTPMTWDEAPLISVTRNYFNRNAVENLGYGVVASTGYVLIEGNLFNGNRHAVAASWGTQGGKGYKARYNYVLEKGFTVCWPCSYEQHFDVHGEHDGYGGRAGERFEIAYNTIRGEQNYYLGQTSRAAFWLRGKPTIGASFHDNVVVHDNSGEAVRLKKSGCGSAAECNLTIGPNAYDADTTNALAVGDFEGDGRDDIFLANGTGWWYSSAGLTEWRFLQASGARITDLRFGRFDEDARTDVLFRDSANWWVSLGGTSNTRLVRSDGTALTDCVFGDFTGDGITDALRADGTSWSLSISATGPWVRKLDSRVRAANIRVGRFTGSRNDEVFWIENNKWHLWYPTLNLVAEDVTKPLRNGDMNSIVVGDFDGDGRADLGQKDGSGWRWLRGGTNTWERLRGSGGQYEYADIGAALLGHFTARDSRLDAIRYASPRFPNESNMGFVIWNGTQDAFAPWTPAWQEMR